MDPLSLLLWGAVLPGTLALLIAAIGTGRTGHAVAAGALAGVLAVDGLPKVPPVEAPDYLPFLALLGLVWGMVPAKPLAGTPLRLLAAGALLWPLTAAMRQYTWSGSDAAVWLGGLSVGVAALWTLSLLGVKRTSPRGAGVALAAIAGLAAVALGGSGSARYGQLAGVVAAAAGGAALVGLKRPDPEGLAAAVPTVSLLLGALGCAGVLFSELPVAAAVLIALAPAGLLLGQRGRGIAGPAVAMLLALAGAGIVIAAQLTAEPDPYGGSGGYY